MVYKTTLTKDVERAVRHTRYPASRSDLIRGAAYREADDSVIHTLQDLPDRTFFDVKDVLQELRYTM